MSVAVPKKGLLFTIDILTPKSGMEDSMSVICPLSTCVKSWENMFAILIAKNKIVNKGLFIFMFLRFRYSEIEFLLIRREEMKYP